MGWTDILKVDSIRPGARLLPSTCLTDCRSTYRDSCTHNHNHLRIPHHTLQHTETHNQAAMACIPCRGPLPGELIREVVDRVS
jgi:hypothetical protein